MVSRRAIACAVLTLAALTALLTSPARGGPLQTDLKVYVDRVKALYPEVEVTGRFYDWRGLSMYRSHAGLHLGYDIAMNAGRGVPAGWAGRVVDIIPWTDSEWGIQVEVNGGYRVTYGHLAPTVHVGDVIRPGVIVGTVMHDHVDIKVKDASGGYVDWGNTYGVLDGSGPWVASNGGLLPAPPWMNGGTTVVSSGPDAMLERYRQQARYAAAARVERDRVRDLVTTLNGYIQQEATGLPQAESQMLAWYKAADDHKVSEAQVEALSLSVKARRTKVNRLTDMMGYRQRDLNDKEAAYKAARDAADATREAALKAGITKDQLSKIDADARADGKKDAAAASNQALDQRLAEAQQKYQYLKERYTQGGASKTQVDEAERAWQRLRLAQALWAHGSKSDARDLNW